MTPERSQRISELLAAVLELPAEERARFLERECRGDEELRAEVESLSSSLGRAGGIWDEPAPVVVAKGIAREQSQLMLKEGDLLGQYRILSSEKLGSGGFAVVYKAWDTEMKRPVAIKVFLAALAEDENYILRFKQEVYASSALNHPNIITVYNFGEFKSTPFIVNEFIDGVTLLARLKASPVKLNEALEIAIQLASGLAAAHASNIVHRDINPKNIMLRRDGHVKILDFGVAKFIGQEAAESESQRRKLLNTETGTVIGTNKYMSPEQLQAQDVDARTDIWSLGVVLYEMVAGRVPFDGPTRDAVSHKVFGAEPAPLSQYAEVPEELQRIVRKALRKDPDERYQSVREMFLDLRDLKRILDAGAEVQARQSSSPWPRVLPGAGIGQTGETETAAASSMPTEVPRVATPEPTPAKPATRHAKRDIHTERGTRPGVLFGGGALLLALLILALLALLNSPAWRGDQTHSQNSDEANGSHRADNRSTMPGGGDSTTGGVDNSATGNSNSANGTTNGNGEGSRNTHGAPPVYSLKQTINWQQGIPWTVAFSRRGGLLASGAEDNLLRVWDAGSGKLTRPASSPDAHTADITSIDFSPDGETIATGSNDRTVKLWSTRADRAPQTLGSHRGEVKAVAFSPHGDSLASAGGDHLVKLWPIPFPQGGEARLLPRQGATVLAVAFSPDGRTIATGSADGAVRLWNLDDAGQDQTLCRDCGIVYSVAFSCDGRMLASSKGNQIRLWEWDGTRWQKLNPLKGHTGSITRVAFSPDCRTLASAGLDGKIRLWDISHPQSNNSVALTEHAEGVTWLSFSPDGQSLASSSYDRSIKIWQRAN